ncbi:ABC-F family ATP-binding cassette domain-containing protein [Chitinophaga rhizosphaerae]|uniref:ABC-F family ATP-binding cassette domain-containing protein n=1 Tax=Chitinophaga rhizosphaerae TaxID=1864947 RepID=UPI000F7FDA2E|nr:ABC-F family ATP-binding cassette domain-containing protein [Chitinophaga rhizosphaerae]
MLAFQDVTYAHPNKDVLFSGLHCTVNRGDKIALIGPNGAGKSTLLRLMAGEWLPLSGSIRREGPPYYIPQHFGQFDHLTVGAALRAGDRLHALHEILAGTVTDELMAALNDDWSIEERCREALAHWGLGNIGLDVKLEGLSGGQKTRVFLAGIAVNQPSFLLLDEPGNHLDAAGRALLRDLIGGWRQTLVLVSHDASLLRLLPVVYELGKKGITVYGGDFDFYKAQKALEQDALHQDLRSREKALRKAKETEREAMERKQKLDARGRKKQEKSNVPTITLNTLRNNAEKSTASLKKAHAEKMGSISEEVNRLRRELPDIDKMKLNVDDSALHKGKILVNAQHLNVRFGEKRLWAEGYGFQVRSGDRLAIRGGNGSGKTTMIRLLLGQLSPSEGEMVRAGFRAVYIDQDYSYLDGSLTVYEQAQKHNPGALEEHEVKTRLNRFLFGPEDWNKPSAALSGGERMRLLLCVLNIGTKAPDMIVLDEPTNNLDMQNVEILTAAMNGYDGTLIVVSHDDAFLEALGIAGEIAL